jgi:hypothetical protein
MKILTNKKNILLLLLLLIIMHSNNFFLNLYTLLKFNSHQRMIKVYGDCGEESYGYIKMITDRSDKNLNIKILNDNPNFSDNNSSWLRYKTNNGYDKKKIILINNKNSLKQIKDNKHELIFKNSNLGFYKILDQKQNCFYLEKYD